MRQTRPVHLVVAINPAAAFGQRRGAGPLAVERLRAAGHEVVALREPSYADLRRAVEAAVHAGTDALVVVGGDGMVHLSVNALAGAAVPLGIVPSGTGNDVARGLGVPVGDPAAAVDALLARLHGSPRHVDLGRVRSTSGEITWFAGVLSGGFDAAVNERANRMRRPRGRSRYTLAILRELAALHPVRYALELDGVIEQRHAVLVAVANSPSFGGGMRVAPDASTVDGRLDVVTLDRIGRAGLLRLLPRVFTGDHVRDARVTVRRVRRVRLDAPGVVAYADGERIGPLPLEVEVVPGALRVLA